MPVITLPQAKYTTFYLDNARDYTLDEFARVAAEHEILCGYLPWATPDEDLGTVGEYWFLTFTKAQQAVVDGMNGYPSVLDWVTDEGPFDLNM
jgi:hypothetical protein